jgi:hypothetical protein
LFPFGKISARLLRVGRKISEGITEDKMHIVTYNNNYNKINRAGYIGQTKPKYYTIYIISSEIER